MLNYDVSKNNLYIFNLATDVDNVLLAPAVDWVYSFSKQCESVTVFSTHVGRHDLPSSVTVKEIGGGSFLKRSKGFFRIIQFALCIIKSDKQNKMVFHHMSPRTALIAGPLFRIAGIPQGLWFAHYKKNIELLLSIPFVNRIFASAPIAFPFKTKKVSFVGQGIVASKFKTSNFDGKRKGIISISRIDPIKSLDLLIREAGRKKFKEHIYLIGPTSLDKKYLEFLLDLSQKMNIKCEYKGVVPNNELITFLSKSSMVYTGNLNTVDKSVIEGAISGNFVLSTSNDVQVLTGMNKIWKSIKHSPETIGDKIEAILHIPDNSKIKYRKELSNLAQERNDIDVLIKRILTSISTNINFKFESEYT